MKENLYDIIRISMNNPNDRKILVLLKYLENRDSKEEKTYIQLLNIYPENEYFEKLIIEELLSLKLMDKNIIKEREQTETGYVRLAEYTPITNACGRLKLASNYFPSESKKHKWDIARGQFAIVISIISVIISILAIIF